MAGPVNWAEMSTTELEALTRALSFNDVPDSSSDVHSRSPQGSVTEQAKAYVSVIIDAQSHPFIHSILDTEHRLVTAVRNVLPQLLPCESDALHIDARVYITTDGDWYNNNIRTHRAFNKRCVYLQAELIKVGGYGEIGLEQKITDQFRQALRDEQCKHILFAAWGRPTYLAMLQTASSKVTLVEGEAKGLGAEVIPLPCKFIQFPDVFAAASASNSLITHYRALGVHNAIGALIDGKFKEQASCAQNDGNLSRAPDTGKIWSEMTARPEKKIPLRAPGFLPNHLVARPGHIPINKDGQRLDYYLRCPSKSARAAFKERSKTGKPCAWFHLVGECRNAEKCTFDHGEISDDIWESLRYVVKRTPCNRGSQCRTVDCIYGHVCMDFRKCTTEEVKECPFLHLHGVDPEVASWEKVAEGEGYSNDIDGSGDAVSEGTESAAETSYWF